MTTRQHRRKRIAEGVYDDRGKRAAVVSLGSGDTKVQIEKRFEKGESLRVIQKWRDAERQRLAKLRPEARKRGTFDADIPLYLKTLADRPRLRGDRTMQLAWWAARRDANGHRFGSRRRHSFESAELRGALAELAVDHGPSTVKHYRTALFHLFTTLDTKNGSNPLRDVPPPAQPEPEVRWLPHEFIAAVIDAMPDDRRPRKLTVAQAAEIYAAAIAPRANRSAVARRFGVSETMVRKIVARKGERDAALCFTKLRLRVWAYTGLPKKQIEKLQEEHVDYAGHLVTVAPRRKGKGLASRDVAVAAAGRSRAPLVLCGWRGRHVLGVEPASIVVARDLARDRQLGAARFPRRA
jgi:transposase-like protein